MSGSSKKRCCCEEPPVGCPTAEFLKANCPFTLTASIPSIFDAACFHEGECDPPITPAPYAVPLQLDTSVQIPRWVSPSPTGPFVGPFFSLGECNGGPPIGEELVLFIQVRCIDFPVIVWDVQVFLQRQTSLGGVCPGLRVEYLSATLTDCPNTTFNFFSQQNMLLWPPSITIE